jgi:ribosomal protein L12E/L44/L45/RPP1/RPP2
MLYEPIKELGDYPVSIRLTRNVSATVNVSVIGEDGTTAADIKARAEGGAAATAAPAAAEAEEEDEAEAEEEEEETAEDE